jgi:hypothetical protein
MITNWEVEGKKVEALFIKQEIFFNHSKKASSSKSE